MDPQHIRDALTYVNTEDEWAHDDETVTVLIEQAAAEYVELLETSERVWWCIEQSIDYNFADVAFITECWEGKRHENEDCGWRLLTPTEGVT